MVIILYRPQCVKHRIGNRIQLASRIVIEFPDMKIPYYPLSHCDQGKVAVISRRHVELDFLNENVRIWIKILLNMVPKDPLNLKWSRVYFIDFITSSWWLMKSSKFRGIWGAKISAVSLERMSSWMFWFKGTVFGWLPRVWYVLNILDWPWNWNDLESKGQKNSCTHNYIFITNKARAHHNLGTLLRVGSRTHMVSPVCCERIAPSLSVIMSPPCAAKAPIKLMLNL